MKNTKHTKMASRPLRVCVYMYVYVCVCVCVLLPLCGMYVNAAGQSSSTLSVEESDFVHR